jgi:hypothetical protein
MQRTLFNGFFDRKPKILKTFCLVLWRCCIASDHLLPARRIPVAVLQMISGKRILIAPAHWSVSPALAVQALASTTRSTKICIWIRTSAAI